MRRPRTIAALLAMVLALGATPSRGDEPPTAEQTSAQATDNEAAAPSGRTPPRLGFIDGEVSFWRPGADNWAPARVNTALAPGDALYTGTGANLEVQIGPRAFVRAGENTQLRLANQEPDFLQLEVTSGHASFDLRGLPSGHAVEVDTPSAAFTIDKTGYYRVDVSAERTTFITRRGGRAMMSPAGGEAVSVASSEQVVIDGTETPRVETYVAPEVDSWDRWNYARTDELIDSMSSRYVSSGVYGTDELDHYGNWRVVDQYGPLWVPDGVPADWAPYSTGRWLMDPYYGWTWVDDAPWGWAPYHYGRWVYANNYWGWAPGPLVGVSVYYPALVGFLGGTVGIGVGFPAVGWVALGWGEPIIPWWGGVGFIGVPCWHGWWGPRVVNNVFINNTTIIRAKQVNVFQNTRVRNAIVTAPADRFGQGPVRHVKLDQAEIGRMKPVQGALPVKASPASLVASSGKAQHPPDAVMGRRVVATRMPPDTATRLHAQGLDTPRGPSSPEPRLVSAPPRSQAAALVPRPPFGHMNSPERPRPPMPPRFTSPRQADVGSSARLMPGAPGAPDERSAPVPRAPAQFQRSAPVQRPLPPARPLPGEPANRLFPGGPAAPRLNAPPVHAAVPSSPAAPQLSAPPVHAAMPGSPSAPQFSPPSAEASMPSSSAGQKGSGGGQASVGHARSGFGGHGGGGHGR